MEKSNGSSFTRRIQALELCTPFPKSNQECNEEKQREESNMKKSKRIATVGLNLNTFWSPILCILYSETNKYHIDFYGRVRIDPLGEEIILKPYLHEL